MLNITMYHFNFNWSDMFKPVNAESTLGNVLGGVIINELGNKLEDSILKRSLSLKNKETGEIITIKPHTKIRINLEETDYTFKRYEDEENLIYLKVGSLDFTYDFSTLDYVSVVLEPKLTAGAIAASALGGTAGFLLGAAAESASTPKYMSTGGGAMMGCTLGMVAGPAVYMKNFHESETIDFSLIEWEVH